MPVFMESEADWVSQFEEAGPLRGLVGSRGWAALPLVAEGRVLGALGLSFQKRRRTSRWAASCASMATRGASWWHSRNSVRRQQSGRGCIRPNGMRGRRRRAANAVKSEFLAAMSHEIRTPINAIQGYAQLLELGLAGPLTDYQRTYLARLASSSHHLLGLVDDVLDLAKVGRRAT